MYIDVYETTYGKFFNISKIKDEIKKFLIANRDKDLSYNYNLKSNNVKLAFITNDYDNTNNIPVFDHPIIIEDIDKSKVVVSDLRKYVKANNELLGLNNVNNVLTEAYAKDKNAVDFIINRAIFTGMLLAEDYSVYSNYYNTIITSYSGFISSIINKGIVQLDADKTIRVHIVAGIYTGLMMKNLDNVDYKNDIDMFIGRFKNSAIGKTIKDSTIKEVLDVMHFDKNDYSELIENIQAAVGSDYGAVITKESVSNKLNNLWYGPGGSNTMLMAIEHMPTWFSLCVAVANSKVYDKSRFSIILDKYKTVAKFKELEDKINLQLEEYKGLNL
ncbi:hypothetical protein ACVWU4_000922 [Campylobacter coli]